MSVRTLLRIGALIAPRMQPEPQHACPCPSCRWLDELVITTKDKLPSCSADALSKIVSALPLLAGDTGAQGYRLAQVVAQAQVGRGCGLWVAGWGRESADRADMWRPGPLRQ